MGDYTWTTVRVKGVPAHLRDAVESAVDAASGIGMEFEEDAWNGTGEARFAGEANMCAADTIDSTLGALIGEHGTEFAYAIWQDPKYEYDGRALFHVPGVGDHETGCDGQGNEHVPTDAVWRAADEHHGDAAGLAAAIDALTGRTVITAFHAHSAYSGVDTAKVG